MSKEKLEPIISCGFLEFKDGTGERIPWRYSKKYQYQYYDCENSIWKPLVFTNEQVIFGK